MPTGSLSLPARLYLLAWDTTKLKVTDAAHLPHLVRAGALTELAQRGLLADVDGIATPTDPDAQTGDPVLDGLLELVEESRPHRWKTWVGLRARVTLDAVRAQLAADGYLRAEKTRVLGVFPSVEYEIDRVAVVDALRAEAREVLEGPVPVEEVPEQDAALVALAAGAELRTLLSGKEQRQYKQRIEDLVERSGATTPALKKAVQEVRSAVVLVMTTTGVPGS
ncbi:GPP34 family phosphoprotein [Streptomyces phaeochromogenes]|uniref:GPP34 family phosphoprotein n=1 Tax=Streptomyces phaeochromogenes TaxID=1923 RepID=A0ABZ1H727_STRPH|nr:GPP34 family phosphoprotein [Streptomyces phaeochromogenes]MCX5600118.1 GPP34 family phosphoprotein [Streptomyces phaeochromogenes]WSD13412.1 GPP34 family phosphoprotein [Streptomyces phaeochromogenes]WSS92119.1 GPP34 family phosphoprotein [Streptomyces phaeochromogenes]WSW19175.1 GPP34 family phosphoprotein [Streptomyces phaeochromogenes]